MEYDPALLNTEAHKLDLKTTVVDSHKVLKRKLLEKRLLDKGCTSFCISEALAVTITPGSVLHQYRLEYHHSPDSRSP
jgi:hypothetical protein